MPDVVNSLIRHLRADATIYGLCGGAAACRVDHDIEPTASGTPAAVYPAIAVSEQQGGEHRGQSIYSAPIAFDILTLQRSDAVTLRDRLSTLFQDKYHLTLASGTADELLCIESMADGPVPTERFSELSAWHVRAMFRFTTPR